MSKNLYGSVFNQNIAQLPARVPQNIGNFLVVKENCSKGLESTQRKNTESQNPKKSSGRGMKR